MKPFRLAMFSFFLVKLTLCLILLVGVVLVIISCSGQQEEQPAITELSDDQLIERGRLLVLTSACHDCHSPKVFNEHGMQFDTTRLLSGHRSDEALMALPDASSDWLLFNPGLTAFVGPWGVSYAANLTPDETGTGAWEFENFKTAIRKGKHKGLEGSRTLLPPMPWEVFAHKSDDELRAMWAYLQSIKPVSNQVPPPISPEDLKKMYPKWQKK